MWSWLQQYASGNASETATPHYCGVNITFEMWSFTFQIEWKQRFFVPTDEEPGSEILTALLNRYPVLISDEASQDVAPEPEPANEMRPPQIIDLEQWIVPISESHPIGQGLSKEAISPRPELDVKSAFPLTAPATVFGSDSRSGLNGNPAQLGFDF
jgi:hypothetical protein